MPLDPQLAALLPFIGSGSRLYDQGVAAARAGFHQLTAGIRDPAILAAVRSWDDVTYPAAERALRARVYRPDVDGPVPTVLYVHGGSFVMGDVDTHDDHARLVCRDTGCVVVSVEYRLAPEDPFPAGYLDCQAALRYVVASAARLGGDPERIGVAGDSAGANLAAHAAIMARDEGLPLTGQLLLYPVTDFADSDRYPSRVDNATGYFLTEEDMRFAERCYGADPADPRASLVGHPDLAGVAPAIIGTAEYDPLRDEGEAFAAALEAAGVPVTLRRFPGLIHGFFGMGHLSAACQEATRALCLEFKELLG